MTQSRSLFIELLGADFQRLGTAVRRVHDGAGGEWFGTASVRRGPSASARCLCTLGGLPRSAEEQPLRVQIDAGGSEVWTRWFGDSPPMRSRFGSRDGCLIERLGPVCAAVRLSVVGDALSWTGERLWILGVPLPRWAGHITARVRGRETRYEFEVSVRLAGIGALIHYQGFLNVDGP